MTIQTFEGTWEELQKQHAHDLAGQRVRLTVLGPAANAVTGISLAEALKDYIGSVKSAEVHADARNSKKIWGDYVLEKHSKKGGAAE